MNSMWLIKNYWSIPELSVIVFSDFSFLTVIADIFSLKWTQTKSQGKGYKWVHSLDKIEAIIKETGL